MGTTRDLARAKADGARSTGIFSDAIREFYGETRSALSFTQRLRGEVLSRWHDYVGTGDLMRTLDQKVSRLRDRVVGFLAGHSQRAEQGGVAAGRGLGGAPRRNEVREGGGREAKLCRTLPTTLRHPI